MKTMYKLLSISTILVMLVSCGNHQNEDRSMQTKPKILTCDEQIKSISDNRKDKISSIARRYTLSGSRRGSGGIGRASSEAEIWKDIEYSKLISWQEYELSECNSARKKSNQIPQNPPPAFGDIGRTHDGSSKAKSRNIDVKLDNRCIQDGGTQMCYDRQSQRYGNN
jgi:hypothetical protein